MKVDIINQNYKLLEKLFKANVILLSDFETLAKDYKILCNRVHSKMKDVICF
jgi:hypothetical protein